MDNSAEQISEAIRKDAMLVGSVAVGFDRIVLDESKVSLNLVCIRIRPTSPLFINTPAEWVMPAADAETFALQLLEAAFSAKLAE